LYTPRADKPEESKAELEAFRGVESYIAIKSFAYFLQEIASYRN
jgi:hypothetical protein